jgi:hypothetical protein
MRPSYLTLAICALLGLSLTATGCAASSACTAASPHAVPSPLPRVAADCSSASPHRLSTRPLSITLACADNGWGVQDLTWTSWTSSAAAGHGMFWDKLCVPSCAAGKIGSYPVTVRLLAVKTSARGPWFSRLTLTWSGARPPRPAPDSFRLTPPPS